MKVEEKYFQLVKISSVRTANKIQYAKLLRAIADLIDDLANKKVEIAFSLGCLDTSDC